MTVIRSLRPSTAMRCGDCLFLVLAITFLLLFTTTLYLRQSSNVNKTVTRRTNEAAAPEQGDDPAPKFPEDIWPAGKMRQVGKKPRVKKTVDKIQAAVERIGLDPIPDTRPEECQHKFHLEDHGKAKIGIVVIPSERTFSLHKLKATLVSLLATTVFSFHNLEIGLVTADGESAKNLRESFVSNSPDGIDKPKFRIFEREDFFEKETLFKELISIAAADFSESDIVIFLTSGMQCNIGWLEAITDPLLNSPHSSNGPAIVAPYFTRSHNNENENPAKILFNWRLAPKFSTQVDEKRETSAVDVVPSLMFMPQAFAIRRKSDEFGRLLSFFSQHNIGDPTVFDAAMYFWRCLGIEVVTAPCARVSLPSGFVESEFDPFMKKPAETKQRLASTWLSEYRAKLEPVLGKWSLSREGAAHCKELSSLITTKEESELFTVPEEFQAKGEYFYLASLAGTTFLPTSGKMRAGICPFPESPDMMFKHMLNGAIQSTGGMCLTAPNSHGYVEISKCHEADTNQQWTFLQSGKLQSVSTRLCMMHATDPASENNTADPKSQVLMTSDCAGDDSNFFKFTFAKNC